MIHVQFVDTIYIDNRIISVQLHMLDDKLYIPNLMEDFHESIDVVFARLDLSYVCNEKDVEQDEHNGHVSRFHTMNNENQLVMSMNRRYTMLAELNIHRMATDDERRRRDDVD